MAEQTKPGNVTGAAPQRRFPNMPDYELYYWSVPFRGQFVRAVLAYAGKS